MRDAAPGKRKGHPHTQEDGPDLRIRGALGGTRTPNLLIRRSRHIVQDRPLRSVCWADIPELSVRDRRCPAAWQQYWQQSRGTALILDRLLFRRSGLPVGRSVASVAGCCRVSVAGLAALLLSPSRSSSLVAPVTRHVTHAGRDLDNPTYGLRACLVRGVPSGDRIWDQVRSSTRRTSRLRNVGGVSQSLPSFSANSAVSGRLELSIASS